MSSGGLKDMLLEYQGYVLAYRLRTAVGGRVTPPGSLLALPEYAARRLRRQDLAGHLIREGLAPGRMRDLDALTDELMFGFWLNPAQVAEFLRAALRQGGHPALGSLEAFAALLTPAERARLGEVGVRQVCVHHLTCLSLAAPLLDPDALGRVWERVEATTPPLFVDELARAGQV
ncbi:hypothetical protein [Deinococcus hopiensis]|uniref:Uncharacterized protein n=1 Tax=Deinococcus hopiensis KR-140 TaxID=695939 RepID=A0A1W1VEJ9_9DEIO|nr:hypothetical protein [Deinococcus hopiensis]SMB91745.1 hypothetical protein SAMN00790413_01276 [Deinococcus hopiensis KR-140]